MKHPKTRRPFAKCNFPWSCAFLFLFVSLSSCHTRTEIQGDILLRNVNRIDMQTGAVTTLPGILIEKDRIKYVLGSANPSGVRIVAETVIDATGKYIIPGLWDMHAHPDDPEVWRMNPTVEARSRLMPLFVCYGVTGIRDMGGDIELVKQWRSQYKEGKLLAPKIYAAGPLLDGPNPMWDGSVGINGPAEVQAVADSLIAQGVDFLKVYSLLPRDTYLALSDYARKIDFPFVGHVPFTVPPSEAAVTGMKSQEHLLEILKECSPKPSPAFLAELDNIGDRIQRSNTLNDFRLSSFNEIKADSLYDLFVEYDIWHCPTLSMWQKNAWYEQELEKDKALLAYLPQYLQDYWTPEINDHLQNRDNIEYIATKKRLYELYLKMVKRMHEKGVRLLAGTDMGANPLCHPGIGLHNELKAFVEAGLTPFEALQTATINPALFFGIENDYGSVDEGKKADLVVLNRNPLESIDHISAIAFVLRDGLLLDAYQIEGIKGKILQANTRIE